MRGSAAHRREPGVLSLHASHSSRLLFNSSPRPIACLERCSWRPVPALCILCMHVFSCPRMTLCLCFHVPLSMHPTPTPTVSLLPFNAPTRVRSGAFPCRVVASCSSRMRLNSFSLPSVHAMPLHSACPSVVQLNYPRPLTRPPFLAFKCALTRVTRTAGPRAGMGREWLASCMLPSTASNAGGMCPVGAGQDGCGEVGHRGEETWRAIQCVQE